LPFKLQKYKRISVTTSILLTRRGYLVLDEYKELHSINPGYGKTGLRLLDYVEPLLEDCKAQCILDFGCGKGALGKSLQTLGYNVTFYDPYVPEHSNLPQGTFDLILCTDVMEHIPRQLVANVLKDLSARSDKILFVISLTFADALLPDGTNAHCTIESDDWWYEQIKERFPTIVRVQTRQPTATSIVTWHPQDQTNSRLAAVHNKRKRSKKLTNLTLWPFKMAAAAWIGRTELRSLRKLIEGKRVAIVGNARSLFDKAYGEEIDSYDIVIRINRGPIMSPKISGTRTSVIASSIWISPGLFRQRDASLMLWLTPKRRSFPLWLLKKKYQGAVFPAQLHRDLTSTLASRPSSGVMAVTAILDCNPSEVTLFGFDGFKSRSLSGEAQRYSGPHDFDAEQELLMGLERNASIRCFS